MMTDDQMHGDDAPSPPPAPPDTPLGTPTTPGAPAAGTVALQRTVTEVVPIASLSPEVALAEYDRLTEALRRDPLLGDERSPAGREFQARRDALILHGKGLRPEDNSVLGTAHGWRLLPIEAERPGAYIELVERGVTADRAQQDLALSVARSLGAEAVTVLDTFLDRVSHLLASGAPPDDIALHQEVTTRWSLAERQALNGRLEDLHAGLDRLLSEQGLPPAQREPLLAVLARVERYGVRGIALLEALSQDLWTRGPQAWVSAYAGVMADLVEAEARVRAAQRQQEEADDAAAQADPTPMQTAATLHDRWGRNR